MKYTQLTDILTFHPLKEFTNVLNVHGPFNKINYVQVLKDKLNTFKLFSLLSGHNSISCKINNWDNKINWKKNMIEK